MMDVGMSLQFGVYISKDLCVAIGGWRCCCWLCHWAYFLVNLLYQLLSHALYFLLRIVCSYVCQFQSLSLKVGSSLSCHTWLWRFADNKIIRNDMRILYYAMMMMMMLLRTPFWLAKRRFLVHSILSAGTLSVVAYNFLFYCCAYLYAMSWIPLVIQPNTILYTPLHTLEW